MLEKAVRFGKDFYIIKAFIPCGNQQIFALECERPISGYDGICPACHGQHLKLAQNRGFYVSAGSVYKVLGQQQLEKVGLQDREKTDKLDKIKDNLPPLDHPILGKNRGIEGNSNSSYMDATIFCMFGYSNVFDYLLHMDVYNKKALVNLQKILRENIVNVLRSESGFVERKFVLYFLSVVKMSFINRRCSFSFTSSIE
jgi:hypothetical protein